MGKFINKLNKKIPDTLTWVLLILISIYLYFFGEYMYRLTHWLRDPGTHMLSGMSMISGICILFFIWLLFAPVKYLLLRFCLAIIVLLLYGMLMPTY